MFQNDLLNSILSSNKSKPEKKPEWNIRIDKSPEDVFKNYLIELAMILDYQHTENFIEFMKEKYRTWIKTRPPNELLIKLMNIAFNSYLEFGAYRLSLSLPPLRPPRKIITRQITLNNYLGDDLMFTDAVALAKHEQLDFTKDLQLEKDSSETNISPTKFLFDYLIPKGVWQGILYDGMYLPGQVGLDNFHSYTGCSSSSFIGCPNDSCSSSATKGKYKIISRHCGRLRCPVCFENTCTRISLKCRDRINEYKRLKQIELGIIDEDDKMIESKSPKASHVVLSFRPDTLNKFFVRERKVGKGLRNEIRSFFKENNIGRVSATPVSLHRLVDTGMINPNDIPFALKEMLIEHEHGDTKFKLTRLAKNLLKDIGVEGFTAFTHFFRFDHDIQNRELNPKMVAVINQALKNGDVDEERLSHYSKFFFPNYSPHLHLIAVGWFDGDKVKKIYEKEGMVFKKVSTLNKSEDIFHTIRYILSHANIENQKKKSTLTWLGCLSNNKFKTPKPDKAACKECGTDLAMLYRTDTTQTLSDILEIVKIQEMKIKHKYLSDEDKLKYSGILDPPLENKNYSFAVIEDIDMNGSKWKKYYGDFCLESDTKLEIVPSLITMKRRRMIETANVDYNRKLDIHQTLL